MIAPWQDQQEKTVSNRTLVSFTVNEKKVDNVRRASGFFANMTLGVDMDSMQALDAYGLRDEQEKYFQQMKGQVHHPFRGFPVGYLHGFWLRCATGLRSHVYVEKESGEETGAT